MRSVSLGQRTIGPDFPVFVIAEAGVNHNGDLNRALQLVDIAVDAGADAVKFQTFRAESIVTHDAPKAGYQIETSGSAESQLAMLRRLELPFDNYSEIKKYCDDRQIMFLSTPFDEEAADLLDALGMPAIKISSGDLTNWPLLEHVAKKKRPVILSTGMANLDEVREAVELVQRHGADEIVLLHCVSNYPANPGDVNLRAMQTMASAFQLPVGYSDHTMGIEVPLAAVAMGACVIEKHFTLDRNLPGPDHRASLEPDELKSMISGIRRVEAALGDGRKLPAPSESEIARVARRSLIAACDIAAGTKLMRPMIAAKRPGTGLSPVKVETIVGRVTRVDIAAGSFLALEMFD